MKLSPLVKGLITGGVLIITSLATYKYLPQESPLHYLVFAVYAIGIVWTLIAWRYSTAYSGRFADGFNAGFRCFVVATLIMAAFVYNFNKSHPEFAEQSAVYYREQLVKENNKSPVEIDKAIAIYKKQYTLKLVSGAIFGYLLIGAAVTTLTAFSLTRRK